MHPLPETSAEKDARAEGMRFALYETGWWCGECDPVVDQGCCTFPPRVRAALMTSVLLPAKEDA